MGAGGCIYEGGTESVNGSRGCAEQPSTRTPMSDHQGVALEGVHEGGRTNGRREMMDLLVLGGRRQLGATLMRAPPSLTVHVLLSLLGGVCWRWSIGCCAIYDEARSSTVVFLRPDYALRG